MQIIASAIPTVVLGVISITATVVWLSRVAIAAVIVGIVVATPAQPQPPDWNDHNDSANLRNNGMINHDNYRNENSRSDNDLISLMMNTDFLHLQGLALKRGSV